MSRRRRGWISIAAGMSMLVAAGAGYQAAAAASCRGCLQQGLAVFNPYAAPDGPGYSLMRTADGRLVRFDPCRAVHYVVNPDHAPPQWRGDLDAALATIEGATGLVFVDDGVTTEAATRARLSYQLARYGDRWAPVLIAWSLPGTSDLLSAGAAGDGGPAWARAGNRPAAIVSGTVVIDAVLAGRLPAGIDDRLTHGRLLAHELGHVVGLGHSADPAALMAPQIGWSADVLTDGDRAGLDRLGTRRGCLAVPRPN